MYQFMYDLQAASSSFIDLLVQGRVGRRGPPVHHVELVSRSRLPQDT